jgi:uncharacterized SAM-binding protein YcdF (DUF218 family)
MKQKDWALVLVMAFVAAVLSLFVSNLLFSSPKHRQQTAEIVDPITANFPAPPAKYFNSDAGNPTQPVQVGNGTNPNPFNSKSQ